MNGLPTEIDFPPLDSDRLRRAFPGRRIDYLVRTVSTNDTARQMADEGAEDGAVVLADEQTAGRGRRGARWVSPAARNLIVSVLRRPGPTLPPERWSRLTLAAALAGCDALDALPGFNARAEVKWPNDLYLSGKKVAGILVESALIAGGGGHVVIGAGLNLNLQPGNFPPELRATATSVWIENGGRAVDRTAFAIAFLRALDRRIAQAADDFASMLESSWSRSWLAGKSVSLISGGQELDGTAVGLGPEGELLLVTEDGRQLTLSSGELVRVAGSGR